MKHTCMMDHQQSVEYEFQLVKYFNCMLHVVGF